MNPITLLGDAQVFGRIAQRVGATPRVLAYVLSVQFAAWLVAAGLLVAGDRFGSLASVLALAVVAAYGERGHITLRDDLTVSISLLPAIFAAVLFGPLAAMVVFGASGVFLPFPVLGRVSYTGSRAVPRIRRGTASIDLRASVFCSVREPVAVPLCGFYAAAFTRLMTSFDIGARTEVVSCRAAGEPSCVLRVNIQNGVAADRAEIV